MREILLLQLQAHLRNAVVALHARELEPLESSLQRCDELVRKLLA
jgi:hypothetical protein